MGIVKQLTELIEQLEREAHRQAAPFRRNDNDKKLPDQHKPPGSPVGHPPTFRSPPARIDDDIETRLDECPKCGRPITKAYENDPADYLVELRALLYAAMFLQANRGDLFPPQWTEKRQCLEDRSDELLLRTTPPIGAAKVAERIRKRRRWHFTFLDDPSLEATNNREERSLRPAVIARKLSRGNKNQRGKNTWEILTSLAVTCQQRSHDFVEFLRPHLIIKPNPVR